MENKTKQSKTSNNNIVFCLLLFPLTWKKSSSLPIQLTPQIAVAIKLEGSTHQQQQANQRQGVSLRELFNLKPK